MKRERKNKQIELTLLNSYLVKFTYNFNIRHDVTGVINDRFTIEHFVEIVQINLLNLIENYVYGMYLKMSNKFDQRLMQRKSDMQLNNSTEATEMQQRKCICAVDA